MELNSCVELRNSLVSEGQSVGGKLFHFLREIILWSNERRSWGRMSDGKSGKKGRQMNSCGGSALIRGGFSQRWLSKILVCDLFMYRKCHSAWHFSYTSVFSLCLILDGSRWWTGPSSMHSWKDVYLLKRNSSADKTTIIEVAHWSIKTILSSAF